MTTESVSNPKAFPDDDPSRFDHCEETGSGPGFSNIAGLFQQFGLAVSKYPFHGLNHVVSPPGEMVAARAILRLGWLSWQAKPQQRHFAVGAGVKNQSFDFRPSVSYVFTPHSRFGHLRTR